MDQDDVLRHTVTTVKTSFGVKPPTATTQATRLLLPRYLEISPHIEIGTHLSKVLPRLAYFFSARNHQTEHRARI